MTRYLRYLRILWTVFCGLACVLLVVLWVRSYWRGDVVHCPTAPPLLVNSVRGVFQVNVIPNDIGTGWGPGWGWTSFSPDLMATKQGNKPNWEWHSDRYTTVVSFPVWAVVLPIAFAAVPLWFQPRRFGLRTLLIATTLIAVVLGMIIVLNR